MAWVAWAGSPCAQRWAAFSGPRTIRARPTGCGAPSGPLAIGWTLDLSGGMSAVGWGLAFSAVAILMALALVVFLAIRPRELEGDRPIS
jgi:hypothetical protein